MHETLKHLEDALDKKYITDAEHLEMFDLADRAMNQNPNPHPNPNDNENPNENENPEP